MPVYQASTVGLSEKEQGDLALRLYLLRGTGTAAVGICDLAERLGPALVRVGPRQVNCIDRGLKSVGITVLAPWFRLAPQRICDLIRMPPERLLALKPDTQNLARLTWVWDLPEPCSRWPLRSKSMPRTMLIGLRATWTEVGRLASSPAARWNRSRRKWIACV